MRNFLARTFRLSSHQETSVFNHKVPLPNDRVRIIDPNSRLYKKSGRVDFLNGTSAYVRLSNFTNSGFRIFSIGQLAVIPQKHRQ